jgi:hypothetical protein
METMETEISQKDAPKFSCETCAFNSSNKYDWNKHLTTAKHKRKQLETMLEKTSRKQMKDGEYICECNQSYHTRSGLYKHKKKCSQKGEDSLINSLLVTPELVMKLITQNQEFKELVMVQCNTIAGQGNIIAGQSNNIIEQSKTISEQSKSAFELASKASTQNSHNTITNSNNKFNLQFFLNETCKNAITADQFVDNIKITFDDLENVGNKGFVDGISDIIIKQLRTLDVTERPFHCTDAKRETMYIKEDAKEGDSGWVKDSQEKAKLKRVVKIVAKKNLNKIPEWHTEHPEIDVLDSNDYDMNHKIIRHSFGEGEDTVLHERVAKKVAKEVHMQEK